MKCDEPKPDVCLFMVEHVRNTQGFRKFILRNHLPAGMVFACYECGLI